jgi:hypothetical protein
MRITRQSFQVKVMTDKKELENVEYLNSLSSTITNDTGCTWEIQFGIAMAKATFKKKKNLFTSKLDLNLRKELVNCYIWSIALCGDEILTLGKLDQKYREIFELLCWRLIKISWSVRNEEVLHRLKEEKNILYTVNRRPIGLVTACVGTVF